MKTTHLVSTKSLTLFLLFLLPQIALSQNDMRWMAPKSTNNTALKNQTMEIGFALKPTIASKIDEFLIKNTSGINPYDPEQLDFVAFFVSPSGKTHRRFGFYYQEFQKI